MEQVTTSAFHERYGLMSKMEVVLQYGQDYEAFLDVLGHFPSNKIDEFILGGWRINEVVAHVASWNLETIKGIEVVMAGGIPWFFDDEKRIDSYNAKETEDKRDIGLKDNLEEVKATHDSLIDFLEKMPDDLFHKSFGRMWRKRKVTPSLVCSYRHYSHHAMDIVRWLGQK